MNLLDSLKTRLATSSRFAQIALASECGDRVYPIYKEYWVGDFYESVLQSIEMGKAYSLGENIDKNLINKCLVELQDIVAYYREEGITVLATTTTVVLRIVQSIIGDNEDTCTAVARCLTSSLDTAQSAETMANQTILPIERNKIVKVAMDEEETWQNAAIKLIDGWSGYAAIGMFDSLGGKPPNWYKDWLLRSVR